MRHRDELKQICVYTAHADFQLAIIDDRQRGLELHTIDESELCMYVLINHSK